MADYFGKFSSNPRTEWLTEDGDDRRMKLLNEFSFEDPKKKTWVANVGAIFDGATIPVALWSLVGSPYTGDYRRAAIVHDAACGMTDILRSEADEMFYFACLCGGCSKKRAQLLYAGVTIGAWIPRIRLWSEVEAQATSIELASKFPSVTHDSIVTTFREISIDLDKLPNDVDFKIVREIVERHLTSKSAQ